MSVVNTYPSTYPESLLSLSVIPNTYDAGRIE